MPWRSLPEALLYEWITPRDLFPSFEGIFKWSLKTTKSDDISYGYVLGNTLLETAPSFPGLMGTSAHLEWGRIRPGYHHEVGPHAHRRALGPGPVGSQHHLALCKGKSMWNWVTGWGRGGITNATNNGSWYRFGYSDWKSSFRQGDIQDFSSKHKLEFTCKNY